MNEHNYLTLVVAFCVAAVVSTLQAIETKMKLTTAVMNMLIAGFAAPTIVWVVWSEAPFFVYSLVAAIVARWPDVIKGAAEKFTGSSK
jgi:hypothetical protein